MEGAEVSVETLSINGECHVIQITDKMTTGAPYFVEMGHSQPSQLPKKTKETNNKVKVNTYAIGKEVKYIAKEYHFVLTPNRLKQSKKNVIKRKLRKQKLNF